MTNGYVINIGNGSVKQWVSFSYEHTLNAMSNCQIALDGVTSAYSTEFDVDSEIYIYKNGTLKFRGIIITKQDLTAGGAVLAANGIELELADNKAPMVGSLTIRSWSSTADHTILSTLVTAVSGWTIDTSNSTSSTVNSFRVSSSESVWNSVIKLIEHTGKDIRIDQTNKKVYLYDELTRDSKFSFIEGKNANGISRTKMRSKAGKVIVYGKGDGDNQIVGSSGASTPVYTIIDRNIITNDQADVRALVEYNKLNPENKRYRLSPIYAIDAIRNGDAGNISNNSAGIDEEVDIVRIITTVNNNGVEKLNLEVTNPTYRLASKNSAEGNTFNQEAYNQSQSSMQGNTNEAKWSLGNNTKNGVPLRIPFYIGSSFLDEIDALRIDSMTLDYDLDPYRKGAGDVSETQKDPSLEGDAASHGHDPFETSTGHDHTNPATVSAASAVGGSEGSDNWSENVGNTWDLVATEGFSGTFGVIWAEIKIEASEWSGTDTIGIKVENDGTPIIQEIGLVFDTTKDPIYRVYTIPIFGSASDDITLYLYSIGEFNYAGYLKLYGDNQYHTHNIGTYDSNDKLTTLDDDNDSPSLTGGNAALHKHDVSIGDDITDEASVNSSEIDIYLDFWNTGTTSWDNKHSVLNTGTTLDEDVDITNSDTYPDATGWWRVRIDPSSSTPDYVQGIVKIKHSLDN